jgi:hypothetical protein
MQFASFGLFCLIALTSCRLARSGGETPDVTDKRPISNVGSPAASATSQLKPVSAPLTMSLSFDQNHKAIEGVWLLLDYFPPPRPDGVSIPSCYPALADDVILGRISCDASPSLVTDLTAAQASQQCLTSSPPKVFNAKLEVELTGCVGKATLKVHSRSPEIKVEIVK